MANISKREFDVFDLSGQKYLEWKVDALAHLKANGLEEIIETNNLSSSQDKAKAIIFLRHHLHESLKSEYLLVDDPKELWDNLQERYGHQQKVLLPKAQYDWINLRFQGFKSISDYNSVMFQITSKLKLCGQKVTDADMLEKTFSTMHISNMLLQQQYREKGFKKYFDLISILLVAEQNNDLLMKNHNLRPTGSSPSVYGPSGHNLATETNATHSGSRRHFKRGHFNVHKNKSHREYKQVERPNYKGKGKQKAHQINRPPKSSGKSTCYKCGMTGHWANKCRTAKHLVELFQASMNLNKGKSVEANYVNDTTPPLPKFDVSDFFVDDAIMDDAFATNLNDTK
ncbi:unnamed protein product [Cuscuta epithymum]|uniref:CCHC-type domain-containing protein n=1 Tax=Cuscuta epithymum TaxID=186058 RepID=A0AAV0GLP1_9ASTE|nr:unnamed protein product [Cuscuta epithymum]